LNWDTTHRQITGTHHWLNNDGFPENIMCLLGKEGREIIKKYKS